MILCSGYCVLFYFDKDKLFVTSGITFGFVVMCLYELERISDKLEKIEQFLKEIKDKK